jgi:hypothetical protein
LKVYFRAQPLVGASLKVCTRPGKRNSLRAQCVNIQSAVDKPSCAMSVDCCPTTWSEPRK